MAVLVSRKGPPAHEPCPVLAHLRVRRKVLPFAGWDQRRSRRGGAQEGTGKEGGEAGTGRQGGPQDAICGGDIVRIHHLEGDATLMATRGECAHALHCTTELVLADCVTQSCRTTLTYGPAVR